MKCQFELTYLLSQMSCNCM